MKRRFFQYLKRRFSFFRYTIAILNLTTLFSVLGIILILLYVLGGTPYINLSNSSKLGLTDFERGIPIPVRIMSGYILDSSFYGQSAHGSWSYSGSTSMLSSQRAHWDSVRSDKDAHVDIITTEFRIWNGQSTTIVGKGDRPAYITDGQLLSGVLHVQTQRKGWRLLLLLPKLLYLSLFAFGAWQVARLLGDILSGAAFKNTNYRRIRNIGWGIIAWQLVLFTLSLAFKDWMAFINFYSTTPGYHSPVQLSVAYEYDLSFSWLTGGGVLLILAFAFKMGNQLQQEQDLTI